MLVELIATLFLVIDPNGARTVWDTQPTAAQVCPGASILSLPANYAPAQGVNNYVDGGSGQAVYQAPAPPPPVVSPNPTAFMLGVLSDTTIQQSPAALYGLLAMEGIAAAYPTNPAQVKAAWAVVIAAQGTANNASGWLTPAIQALVEGYATTNNMPLR